MLDDQQRFLTGHKVTNDCLEARRPRHTFTGVSAASVVNHCRHPCSTNRIGDFFSTTVFFFRHMKPFLPWKNEPTHGPPNGFDVWA